VVLFLGRYRQVELELCWQFLLGVQSVGEVDATDAAVGVDLEPQTRKQCSDENDKIMWAPLSPRDKLRVLQHWSPQF